MARVVNAPLSESDLPAARLVQHLPMPMPRWRALLELVGITLAALGAMGSVILFAALLPPKAHSWSPLVSNLGLGLPLIIAAILMLRLAGHHCITIGWTARNGLLNAVLGLIALLPMYMVLFCAGMILVLLRPDLLEKQAETQTFIKEVIPDMPFVTIVLLMLWITFWEEFIFRGFLLTRLHALCGRWWLAITLGALIFGALHLKQGPLAAAVIGLQGLAIGTLFAWRKSLIPGWAFHFAHNSLIVQLVHCEFFNLPG